MYRLGIRKVNYVYIYVIDCLATTIHRHVTTSMCIHMLNIIPSLTEFILFIIRRSLTGAKYPTATELQPRPLTIWHSNVGQQLDAQTVKDPLDIWPHLVASCHQTRRVPSSLRHEN